MLDRQQAGQEIRRYLGRSPPGHQVQDEQDSAGNAELPRLGGTFCNTGSAVLLAIPVPKLGEHVRAQERQHHLAIKPCIGRHARQYRPNEQGKRSDQLISTEELSEH